MLEKRELVVCRLQSAAHGRREGSSAGPLPAVRESLEVACEKKERPKRKEKEKEKRKSRKKKIPRGIYRMRLAVRRLLAVRRAAPRTLRCSARALSDKVSFTFVEEGEEVPVAVEHGKTLLEAAHANEVDLEGACDGSLACSTCHLILEQELYDQLPPPEEEELDMLDLAFGLTDTSRLGCQLKVGPEFEGAKFTLPGPDT